MVEFLISVVFVAVSQIIPPPLPPKEPGTPSLSGV